MSNKPSKTSDFLNDGKDESQDIKNQKGSIFMQFVHEQSRAMALSGFRDPKLNRASAPKPAETMEKTHSGMSEFSDNMLRYVCSNIVLIGLVSVMLLATQMLSEFLGDAFNIHDGYFFISLTVIIFVVTALIGPKITDFIFEYKMPSNTKNNKN